MLRSDFARLADAEFRLTADVEGAVLAKGLEEAVEEDLGLAFFVAGVVGAGPGDEGGKFVAAVGDHGQQV